jgi:hypothetical protein
MSEFRRGSFVLGRRNNCSMGLKRRQCHYSTDRQCIVFAVDQLQAKVSIRRGSFRFPLVTGRCLTRILGEEERYSVFTARRKFVEAGDRLCSLGGGGCMYLLGVEV